MYFEKQEEWKQKAEALRPALCHQRIVPQKIGVLGAEGALKKGDSVVFDFGDHFVGRVKFQCTTEGSHPDAPGFLKLSFCETARELTEDSSAYEGWISKSWIQEEYLHIDVFPAEVSLPRRYAFRYVKVTVIDSSPKYAIRITNLESDTVTSAADDGCPAFFGTESERRLDQIAVRTLRSCMQEVFEDGPKRDRRLWLGDLRLQALTNYETFRNNALVRRCLYLFAACADADGRVPACLFTEPDIEGDDTYMFDYSLFFISVLRDYCAATGDLVTGAELLEVAVRQLQLAQAQFDERDLIIDSEKTGWCFVDWNLKLNKQASAQAIYLCAAEALRELLAQFPEAACARDLRLPEDIARKRQAMREHLYEEERGLVFSGEAHQYSFASQAWAVLAGVLTPEEGLRALREIQSCADAVRMVTPYMYHNYVEALVRAGDREEAYRVMTGYWGAMAAQGADTFYELFDPKNPDESPYGSSIVNSYCHAWSCTPAYFLRHEHLTAGEDIGLAGEGSETLEIAPKTGEEFGLARKTGEDM